MRGFIVLCFATVAFAAPQGYNYNAGSGFSGGSLGSGLGSGLGNGFVGGLGGGLGGGIGSFGSSGAGFSSGFGSSGGFAGHSAGGHEHHQPIVTKRFFIHSAPEEHDGDTQERHITVGVPRKNYNVVFIKSPHSSHHKASIKITPAVNEEKTVIYVLNKKTDSSDIQAEVVENSAPTHKPEVFYIKYKTNEEAAHAQQQIQAQYDALGGSSQTVDEGTIPVSSVIGSLGGGDAGHGGVHGGSIGSGISSGSFGGIGGGVGGVGVSHGASGTYLPPNH